MPKLVSANLEAALTLMENDEHPADSGDAIVQVLRTAMPDAGPSTLGQPGIIPGLVYDLLRATRQHLREEELAAKLGHLPETMRPDGAKLVDPQGRPIGVRSELQEALYQAARFGVDEVGAHSSPESANVALEGLVGIDSATSSGMGPAEIVLRICERVAEALETIPPAVELSPQQRARLLLEEAASVARRTDDAMAFVQIAAEMKR